MLKATHIYRNGEILTMDSRCSTVSCMAVHDETILAVGSEEDVCALASPETHIIDLKGQCMLPGLYDCHSHYIRAGMYNQFYINVHAHPIGRVRCHEDLKNIVRREAQNRPAGEWLLCAGYDDTGMTEQRHFTLAELDALAPEHPLYLRHISGHLALCNSRALAAAGITDAVIDPPGGVFRRDADGHLNGRVEEPEAMEMVLAAAPAMTEQKWLEALVRAGDDYASQGVTSAHDGGVTTEMWRSYMRGHAEGLLKTRVQLLPKHGHFDFLLTSAVQAGTVLTRDKMLSMGAVKLFQDGSLQGYTGWLSNPYHKTLVRDLPDPESWRGYPIYQPENLADMITAYHRQGRQVAVHGNGDSGIEDILNAFEVAQKSYPRADARHIVIHCQTAREDQLDRIARLGVVPSFFVVHTYYWGDRHRDIFLGEARAARINPLRSALARRIKFTNHNDSPVTPMNPLLSVWSAVNRLTSSGKQLGPQQTISVTDALKSVTIWAAHQFHEEYYKGSLEPGKIADMTILEQNPLRVAPEAIKDIAVRATVVGNRPVYGQL